MEVNLLEVSLKPWQHFLFLNNVHKIKDFEDQKLIQKKMRLKMRRREKEWLKNDASSVTDSLFMIFKR